MQSNKKSWLDFGNKEAAPTSIEGPSINQHTSQPKINLNSPTVEDGDSSSSKGPTNEGETPQRREETVLGARNLSQYHHQIKVTQTVW